VFAEIEHNPVARDGYTRRTEIQIPPRQTSIMEMLNTQRRPDWLLGYGIETLRPETPGAVPIGPVIQEV
jgi:hypothetical protein